MAERKKIDDLFADLDARNMKLSGWPRRFGEAKKLYLHHIREEEKILTLADQACMRRVFNRRTREEKARARVSRKIRLK